MKLIYVCSAYRGVKYKRKTPQELMHEILKNVTKTKLYCSDIVSEGHIPIAPHIYFTQFMNDDIADERNKAFKMNLKLLDMCDEMWVYGKEISDGMQIEIDYAIDNKMRIVFKGGCK